MLFGSETETWLLTSCQVAIAAWLSLSGSDQAREGRLVDALAVRGDEGRDTLRFGLLISGLIKYLLPEYIGF